MTNPNAVKLASTEAGRKLRVISRGTDKDAYPEESAHIRDYPESVLPRLVAEAMEVLAAKIADLEERLEKYEELLEECERGHNS